MLGAVKYISNTWSPHPGPNKLKILITTGLDKTVLDLTKADPKGIGSNPTLVTFGLVPRLVFRIFIFIFIYPIFRAKKYIYVQRITGGMCGDTFLPSITDPFLQSLWRLAVRYCWIWSVVWVLRNHLRE